jgi:HSP20 family molecular chaperone IbpA
MTPTFLSGAGAEELEKALFSRICERAYLVYEQSGCVPGNDDANWARAEAEILRSDIQIRESGSWLALTASLPGASPQEMQIVVRPRRVLMRAWGARKDLSQQNGQGAGEIFAAGNLTAEVDPSSAAASFKEQTLHLMVRKRRPNKLS